MAVIRELELKVIDWEARYILEALSKEMTQLKSINQSSAGEDEVADAGNDYTKLAGLYERLSSAAVETFGSRIMDVYPYG